MLPVQGNVYMLVADGVNLAASVGPDGVLLVNSGAAAMTDKVQAALAQLATRPRRRADAQPLHRRQLSRAAVGLGEPVHQHGHQLAAAAAAAALHRQHERRGRARRRQREDRGERLLSARRRIRRRRGHQRPQRVGDRARERAQPDERVGQQAAAAVPGSARGPPTRSSTSCTSCRSTSTARRSSSTTRRRPPPTPTAWCSSATPR